MIEWSWWKQLEAEERGHFASFDAWEKVMDRMVKDRGDLFYEVWRSMTVGERTCLFKMMADLREQAREGSA